MKHFRRRKRWEIMSDTLEPIAKIVDSIWLLVFTFFFKGIKHYHPDRANPLPSQQLPSFHPSFNHCPEVHVCPSDVCAFITKIKKVSSIKTSIQKWYSLFCLFKFYINGIKLYITFHPCVFGWEVGVKALWRFICMVTYTPSPFTLGAVIQRVNKPVSVF